MSDKYCILERVKRFKKLASARYCINEDAVHLGHLALEGLKDNPEGICQIDAATGESETNASVAKRSCRLASAMAKSGLKPGEVVIIMGHNHLDLCIPYYACQFGGYTMCAMDPTIGANDLIDIFRDIHPKMVFCQKSCEQKVVNAFKANIQHGEIVTFDDPQNDLKSFSLKHNGHHINYRPADIDQSKATAWLMLTSGTTGLPKVAIIPYGRLLNALLSWWSPFPEHMESCLAMATLQWVSSLIYFIACILKGITRIQSSETLTPERLIKLIATYRPTTTAFTPYLLEKFLDLAETRCDLSCFKIIAIGGSAMEKSLIDRFRKVCPAFLFLVYGMTELLAPIFDYDDNTPFGSTGKPLSKHEFKIADEEGRALEEPNQTGELWLRGNSFFTGYLNNEEETKKMITEDGWVRTGDMFYKDKDNFYYFVERKRLLIKHYGFLISPLKMEEILKSHPSVSDACVVGIPDPNYMELPVAAVLRRNGDKVDAQELADLLRANMEGKKLNGAIVFVDSMPVTPSGKIHRAKVRELTLAAPRVMF
ncbi:luciferin 4-monooxygenase-like [Trichoplusia ni]|uniref:Luciferin 4-monooxygenase-like n=1 Tax=Trichoplusia ni TaxID=7111 RepID=A0A7E5VM34_TRINI|nr:luciferin 4-monooxygenase-like [Trichoplusia ni]